MKQETKENIRSIGSIAISSSLGICCAYVLGDATLNVVGILFNKYPNLTKFLFGVNALGMIGGAWTISKISQPYIEESLNDILEMFDKKGVKND